MTSDRPYRLALTVDEAATEVRRCSGTQFSPAVVNAFFGAFRRRPTLFEPNATPARVEPDKPYQVAAIA
jgi:HD-GYP domain-containing protein (c-di-GMP phosphodiesterase class II)